MRIDKAQVLNLISARHGSGKAEAAEADLPDPVDTERDAELLQQYGLETADLHSEFGTGISDEESAREHTTPGTLQDLGRLGGLGALGGANGGSGLMS